MTLPKVKLGIILLLVQTHNEFSEFMVYALKNIQPDMIVLDDSFEDVINEVLDQVQEINPFIYKMSKVESILESGPVLDIKETKKVYSIL